MSYFLKKTPQNLWVGKFSSFPPEYVNHGISTRLSGVSEKPYASLNLALHVGDVEEKVLENRNRFAVAVGVLAERICTAEQIHSDVVTVVTEADAGRGSRAYAEAIKGTDALITNVPELPLMLCFADCTPLLFFDEEHRAIGIAHGGWKGTVQRIAGKTLRAMEEQFGTRAENCLAAIGPAIGPKHYAVGEEVAANFRKEFSYAEEFSELRDGKTYLNLWEANRRQLLEAGMKDENIDMASACTVEDNAWYFSYRAEGAVTGRIAALISLVKEEVGRSA